MIGHKWSVTKETSACTDFDLKIVFISGKHVPLFGVMVEFRGDPFPHISYGVITATKSDMGKDYVGDDVRCFVSRNPNETHSGNTFWGHARFCSGNRFWDYILEIYFERKFWIFSRLSPRGWAGWDTSSPGSRCHLQSVRVGLVLVCGRRTIVPIGLCTKCIFSLIFNVIYLLLFWISVSVFEFMVEQTHLSNL